MPQILDGWLWHFPSCGPPVKARNALLAGSLSDFCAIVLFFLFMRLDHVICPSQKREAVFPWVPKTSQTQAFQESLSCFGAPLMTLFCPCSRMVLLKFLLCGGRGLNKHRTEPMLEMQQMMPVKLLTWLHQLRPSQSCFRLA